MENKQAFSISKECPTCGGSGFDDNTDPSFIEEYAYLWNCKTCEGIGYIWTTETELNEPICHS